VGAVAILLPPATGPVLPTAELHAASRPARAAAATTAPTGLLMPTMPRFVWWTVDVEGPVSTV